MNNPFVFLHLNPDRAAAIQKLPDAERKASASRLTTRYAAQSLRVAAKQNDFFHFARA